MIKSRETVDGPNLWRVGFHWASFAEGIGRLSGLVDIVDVVWVDQDDALFLLVRKVDESSPLFTDGSLRAVQLESYTSVGQPLYVDRTARQMRRSTSARQLNS